MGRGILYYLVESIVFILCGYTIHIGLARYLGAAQYGIFGVIISLSTMSYIFFNLGVRTTISKYAAEDDTLASAILIAGLKIQIFFGIIITVATFLLADLISEWLNDHTLAPFIRLSALAIFPSALYAVYLGLLNGRREFGKLTITSISYSVSKLIAIFLFVSLGFGVKGAIGGFIVAGIMGLLVGKGFVNFQTIRTTFSPKKIISFAIPLVIFSMTISFLMNIDLLLVKSILKDNILTGFYTAASNSARPLWFLSTAIARVLLPFVSIASSNNDIDLTRRYINDALRYALMLFIPLTFIISGTAESLVQLLYSGKFLLAGKPLSILIFGFLFVSVFSILSAVITAIGRPRLSLTFVLLIVPINLVLNFILIPRYQIVGAALATSISFLAGLILAAWFILREYNTLVYPYSLLRISVASLIVYVLSIISPASGIALLSRYLYLFTVYFVLLFLLKELNNNDFKLIKNSFPFFVNAKLSKTSQS
jgi:stage V sporulation protein B